MPTFIMLTRLSHQALRSPKSLSRLNSEIAARIRADAPGVEWESNYVVLGPVDYLDVFTAPNLETAMKVATIIRTFGHATTEIWGATEWDSFLALTASLRDEDRSASEMD